MASSTGLSERFGLRFKVVFSIALIYGWCAASYFGVDSRSPVGEQTAATVERFNLSQPMFSTDWISSSLSRADSNFGFRNLSVEWYYRQRYWLFGAFPPKVPAGWGMKPPNLPYLMKPSIHPQVLIGREGWLHYTYFGEIEDYRRTRDFTEKEYAAFRSMVLERYRYCRERGIEYLLIMVPNKSSVYPETMPSSIPTVDRPTGMSLLARQLASDGVFCVLDTTSILIDGKAVAPTFFKTDTHWTDFGAMLSAVAALDRLKAAGVPVRPVAWDSIIAREETFTDGDLGFMIGFEGRLPEQVLMLEPGGGLEKLPVEREKRSHFRMPRGPNAAEAGETRLVLFHDSFGVRFVPFVASGFDETFGFIYHQFDVAEIEAKRPTVVIELFAERGFMSRGLADPFPGTTEGDFTTTGPPPPAFDVEATLARARSALAASAKSGGS